MNERKKPNVLQRVNSLDEVAQRDVAISTTSNLRFDDSQVSRRHSTIEVLSSFPGISRYVNESLETETSFIFAVSNEDVPKDLKQAVEFLHTDNAFFDAASTGNHLCLEHLITVKKTNIHQLNQLGRNALHIAACSGNEYAVKLLLEAGLSPNTEDHMGMTPLSLCLLMKVSLDDRVISPCNHSIKYQPFQLRDSRPSLRIAKLLFDYGANIPRRIGPMDTGLFMQFITLYTPSSDYEKIIILLVEKGALVNDRSAPGGRQALHIAAMGNNCWLIKILVELGAKIHYKNHRGETPLEFARIFKCKEAVALLENLDVSAQTSDSSSDDDGLSINEEASRLTTRIGF